MQHPQDNHLILLNAIGGDVGSPGNDQFSRSFNPACSAHLRKLQQALDARLDAFIDSDCGQRAVRFDVIEDCFTIGKCKDRPFEEYGLPLIFAEGRRPLFGKVRLDLLVRNCGARIVQSFLYFGAEPCIVFSSILSQRKGQRAFVGGSRQ